MLGSPVTKPGERWGQITVFGWSRTEMSGKQIQRLQFDRWTSLSDLAGELSIDLHCTEPDSREIDFYHLKLDQSRFSNFRTQVKRIPVLTVVTLSSSRFGLTRW